MHKPDCEPQDNISFESDEMCRIGKTLTLNAIPSESLTVKSKADLSPATFSDFIIQLLFSADSLLSITVSYLILFYHDIQSILYIMYQQ